MRTVKNHETDPDGLKDAALVAGNASGHRAARLGLPFAEKDNVPPEFCGWNLQKIRWAWTDAFIDGWAREIDRSTDDEHTTRQDKIHF